jgi:hypothetical protein
MIGIETVLERDDALPPQRDLYNPHNDSYKLHNISAYFSAWGRAE